jgi:hypothetical protein
MSLTHSIAALCGNELAREGCLSDVFACLTQRFREQARSYKGCIDGDSRVSTAGAGNP